MPSLPPLSARLASELASLPPAELKLDLLSIEVALVALVCATLFALLRRSIAQSTPERVLEGLAPGSTRSALERLLSRSDRLTTSAAVLELACTLAFSACVVRVVYEQGYGPWSALATGTLACVPVLWFATDALPRSLALRVGDRLVRASLRPFRVLQLPIELVTTGREAVRRSLLRLFGVHDDPESTRQIVAGLREVIEDAELSGRLDDSEKEMIGKVMELRETDAAALMTPRTRIVAADIDEGLAAAARLLAESGHSRIPVYQGSVDRVIGTLTARDVVQAISAGPLESADFRALLHTPMLVPETTKVRGLLAEMRRQRTELAVVVDEYGGTAGLISIGDIVSEIVGEIPDEYDEDAPAQVRRLADGAVELDAGLHVSEVNEQFDLELPEEADYETLGGYVLAELGRFPQRGESFERDGVEFRVLDSSDRRVLKVRVRKLSGKGAS